MLAALWMLSVSAAATPVPAVLGEGCEAPMVELRSPDALWKAVGLPRPCRLFQELLRPPKEGDPTTALTKAYGLSPDGVQALINAELAARAPDAGDLRSHKKNADALRVATQALLERGRGSVVAYVFALEHQPWDERQASILTELERDPQGTALAGALVPALHLLPRGSIDVAAFALMKLPARAPAILRSYGFGEGGEESTALYLGLERATAGQLTPAESTLLSDRIIRNLLGIGLYGAAAATFKRAPSGVQDAIARAKVPATSEQWSSDKGAEVVPADEMRLELALALVEAGEVALAAKLRALLGPQVPVTISQQRRREERKEQVERDVLDWHFSGKRPADPFDLVVGIVQAAGGAPLGALAPIFKGRYAKVLSDAFRWHREELRLEIQPSAPITPYLPIGLSVLAEAERTQRDRDRALLGLPAVTSQKPRSTNNGGVPAAWRERPLPAGAKVQSVPAADDSEGKAIAREEAPIDSPLPLPPGFWPVRVDREGRRLTAIAISQAVDPRGEASGGGYWLFRPENSKRWAEPLYLGLREYQPYVVTARSAVPLLGKDGARLTLEVRVRELDESSLTFPPVSMAMKREGGSVLLEAALKTLQMDADGDGLSDLIEERMLLNAQSPDTDGDGLFDKVDPLPNIPASSPEMNPEAPLWEEFLSRTLDVQPGIMTGVLDLPGAGKTTNQSSFSGEGGATFLIGDRARWTGVDSPSRLILLSKSDYEKAQQLFGAFYPLEVPVIFFNATGDRVFLRWDAQWHGGEFAGTKTDRGWTLERLSSWVS